jgi:hypothetical protein
VRLEGSLDTFGLSDIFTLLSMTGKSGALHLARDGVEAVVHFRDGAISSAVSDRSRHALARRLVGTGVVDAATLTRATESLDAASDGTPPRGLVGALSELAKVAPDVLRKAAEEQILDAVFDLLRWPDGTFGFDVDEPDPDDVDVRRPVDEVLTGARQRLDSWAGRKTSVPTRDTVLSVAAAIGEDATISPPEWAVLALVDGVRSVAELCELAGRGDYVTVTTLADLVDRGLLHADAAGVRAVVERQRALSRWERRSRPPAPPSVDGDVGPEANREVPAARRTDRGRPAGGTARKAAAGKDSPPADDPELSLVPAAEPAAGAASGRANGASAAASGRANGAAAPAAARANGAGPAAAGGLGPSVPPGFIARDPSVNKSLLLRLIAGVRGL